MNKEEKRLVEQAIIVLDEVSADLKYLLGRASIEGYVAGQQLADKTRAKMDEAINIIRGVQK